MALIHYFSLPFAVSGSRDAIPTTDDAAGPISYQYGYGSDYSLPRETDPSALTIPRESFNELMYTMSASIQQIQQLGVPWFISSSDNGGSPYSYSVGAVVRYDTGAAQNVYISKINANTTLPTNATNWLLTRIDPAYLGVAQTFTAIQTFSAAGTPIIVDSTNSTGLKTTFKDNGVARGGLGATSAWTSAFYLADLTTLAGGFDTGGNFAPGAAATYDLGTTSLQYRNILTNRLTVLGSSLPTNGLYLPAANTVGVAANSLHSASFTSTGLNDTPIGVTTPQPGTFTVATANSFIPNNSVVPTNGLYLPAANTLGLAVNGAAEVQLTATAFSPAVSDGNALGTTALQWGDLFLATGGVINFNNGDATLTHSAGFITSNATFVAGAASSVGMQINNVTAASTVALLQFKANSGASLGYVGANTAFANIVYESTGGTIVQSIDGSGNMALNGGVTAAGNLTMSVANKGLLLKRGVNGKCGTFIATGVTPVSVANTSIAITDTIVVSLNTVGGTVGVQPHVATITAGIGFTVVCTASDTSTYNYAIISNAA